MIPYLIGLGFVVVAVFVAVALGFDYKTFLTKYGNTYKADLTRADMATTPGDYFLVVMGVAVGMWIALMFLLFESPLLLLAAIPLCGAVSMIGGRFFLKFRAGSRQGKFADQLEQVLRMISGSMRVGMSLRQAVVMVTEEMPDPARREFSRALGRANMGIPIVDCFDEIAASMPGGEMEMFSKVVRVQQSTGGDLAKVLEKLAATIRDRRQIRRKMSALTAQGRFGAGIIGLLPVGVGGFIMATQPDMQAALLHTVPGYFVLGLAIGLECMAIFTLSKILQLDV